MVDISSSPIVTLLLSLTMKARMSLHDRCPKVSLSEPLVRAFRAYRFSNNSTPQENAAKKRSIVE
jgi:hypothetical protein